MPRHNRKRKAEIRAHMEQTGLPYAAAAAALDKADHHPEQRDPEDSPGPGGPCPETKRLPDEADAVINRETEL